MSRYSRYPYQNASGNAVHAPLQPQVSSHQPQLRNPWVADRATESQSTNSSSSSRTYRGVGGGGGGGGPGPPPPMWHAPPPPAQDHFNHLHMPPHSQPTAYGHVPTHARATHYLIDHPMEALDGAPPTAHLLSSRPGLSSQAQMQAQMQAQPHVQPLISYATSSRAASDRDRPITPASSPGGASGSGGGGGGGGGGASAGSGSAAVDGCGGHCVAFENFCYYCLQMIFIAGILTGVSLTIAGSLLRGAPPSRVSSVGLEGGEVGGGGGGGGGDLVVLVYIGCMLVMVCALLLAVQCCVRRNVKRRKRALRAAAGGRRGASHPSGVVALPPPQHPPPPPPGDAIPLQDLQYQPLLVRLVQQQATAASSSSSTNQRMGSASTSHYHRPAPYREDAEELDASRSGTPWWRRRADARHPRPPLQGDGRL